MVYFTESLDSLDGLELWSIDAESVHVTSKPSFLQFLNAVKEPGLLCSNVIQMAHLVNYLMIL